MDKIEKRFRYADRLSDQIVTATNRTLEQMKDDGQIEPLQLLMGVCLGFMALMKTLPSGPRPASLKQLQKAVQAVLLDASGILIDRP